MHCLSSVCWVITPLHVSGVSAAHHQAVECIYVANGTCYTSKLTVCWQLTKTYNKYHLSHTYNLPPNDGLLICSKKVEVCYLLTYLLTHSLIPWSRVLLEKLTGLQLVKKFPTFYGTQRFITTFTSSCHLSLSWASSIQSIPPLPGDLS
jgi:hypothetical protein